MSDENEREPVAGGLAEVTEKDEEVTQVVDAIKPELEKKSGKQFESLEVIHYRPQTVAGKNYFVKARAKETNGETQIVHLRIYKHFRGNISLTAFQLDKKEDDVLAYFQ
jgi:cystatin-A/B